MALRVFLDHLKAFPELALKNADAMRWAPYYCSTQEKDCFFCQRDYFCGFLRPLARVSKTFNKIVKSVHPDTKHMENLFYRVA